MPASMAEKVRVALLGTITATSLASAQLARADLTAELVNQVSLERIEAHIVALEGPRDTVARKADAAAYIEEQFRSSGYEVERVRASASDNLIAERAGARTAHKIFIVGAHYDTVRDTPGADDNGSGVAGLLEIAHLLRGVDPGATIRFVAFADEELGLVGSMDYAEQVRAANHDIIGMLVLEMIGYTCSTPGCQFVLPSIPNCFQVEVENPDTGEFIGVVANEFSGALLDDFLTAAGLYVPDLHIGWALVRGTGGCVLDTRRSDHSPFWDRGYRGLMITDTANFRNPHYHQPTDTLATLDLPFLRQVTQAALATTLRVVALAADLELTPTRTARPTSTPTPEPTPLPSSARLQAFVANGDILSVLDIESGTVTAKIGVGGGARGLTLSRDGAKIYFACDSPCNAMRVLDVATNTVEATIPVGRDPWGVVLSPDEGLAYVPDQGDGSGLARLNVIDTAAMSVIDVIPAGRSLRGLAVSPDGQRAYTSDWMAEAVHAIDLVERRMVATIPLIPRYTGNNPGRSVLSHDGSTLYVAEQGAATFVVIDTATNSVIDTLPTYRNPSDMIIGPDGHRIYSVSCCAGGEPKNVVAVDTSTNTIADAFPLPSDADADEIVLGPDGRSAYVPAFQNPGSLLVVDLETGEIVRSITLADGRPGDVAVGWVSNPGPPTSPTPRPTQTPRPTATPCGLECAGDCRLDGDVTVDEVIFITNVALGVADLRTCAAADVDADCKVTVDEVIAAVGNALTGCAEDSNRARGCDSCF